MKYEDTTFSEEGANDRLRLIMLEKKIRTSRDFAKLLGKSPAIISRYINIYDKVSPIPWEFALEVQRKTGYSALWIKYNLGPKESKELISLLKS